jgi:hypothetical protein
MDLSFLEDDSPFAFGKVAVGETFVNRTAEKKRLAMNFANRVNTTLGKIKPGKRSRACNEQGA